MSRTRALRLLLVISLIVFSLSSSPRTQAETPDSPPAPRFLFPQLPVLNSPNQAVAADFNGDGNIDLAVTESSAVEVFLGKGNGAFRSTVAYPVRSGIATAVAVGDMNNDGIPDLIVTAVQLNPSVSIFLGKGDGTFETPKRFPVDPDADAVGLGDFNEDGNLDVVVTGRRTIGLLLGNGDGTLQPLTYLDQPGLLPTSLAIADFNGDGHLDIAFANENVTILYGNGNGTFQPPQVVTYASAGYVTVADINNDGILDILEVDQRGYGVLFSNGNGTFQFKHVNASIGQIAVGDFNGDGKLDIANSSYSGISIMLGDDRGDFAPSTTFYTDASRATPCLAADLNNDGSLDLVHVDYNAKALTLFFGNGEGGLAGPQDFLTNGTDPWLAVADFNNDGKYDVAAIDPTGTGGILLGNGNGTFQAPLSGLPVLANTAALAVGDFNNDHNTDLLVLQSPLEADGTATLLLGQGNGTFLNVGASTTGFESNGVVVADFNHDGNLDIAVSNACMTDLQHCLFGNVSVLLGNGDGTFQPAADYPAGSSPNSVAVADFNGDGIPDLAVADSGKPGQQSGVSLLLGRGNGTFQTAVLVDAGNGGSNIIAADFNGDGKQDIALLNGTNIEVLLGDGTGNFSAPIISTAAAMKYLITADVNGDGIVDIVGSGTSGVDVLTGNGDGTFGAPVALFSGTAIQSVATALLGNDLLPDLLIGENLGPGPYQGPLVVVTTLGRPQPR